MAGCCSRGLLGGWMLLYALLLLAGTPSPSPVETMTKLVSLASNVADLSCLRAHANCLYTALGVVYVVAAVEVFHGTCLGSLLAILVTLVSCLTFDNPLLSPTKHDGRQALILAHIVVLLAVLSLACCQKGVQAPTAAKEKEQPEQSDREESEKDDKKDDEKEKKAKKKEQQQQKQKQKHKDEGDKQKAPKTSKSKRKHK